MSSQPLIDPCHLMERPAKRTRRHSTAHVEPDTGDPPAGAPCEDASADTLPASPCGGRTVARAVAATATISHLCAPADVAVLPVGCVVGTPAYRASPAVPTTTKNKVQLFATAMVEHCHHFSSFPFLFFLLLGVLECVWRVGACERTLDLMIRILPLLSSR